MQTPAPTPAMPAMPARLAFGALALLALSGCAAVELGGAVVGTTARVAGAGISLGGAVVSGTVDAVTPDGEEDAD
ncbi:MAG: hypothetical protein HXY25_12560 [Alphaproteobacteria bacterium]|nr:hypothetical protein [Alphaproteobacteria bacterium]